jgi:hypothetical protein
MKKYLRKKIYRIISLAFREEIIRDGFRGIPEREPEESKLKACGESFPAQGIDRLIKNIIPSPEHWEKTQADYAEELTGCLYRGILEREPDGPGLKSNSENIKKNGLGKTITQFIKSPEFEKRYNSIAQPKIFNLPQKKPIFFVHCEKTGGTTLNHLIASHFNQNHVFYGGYENIFQESINKLRSYELISGHFLLSDINWIPGDKKIISMFRDPYTRMTSWYNFIKAHEPDQSTNKKSIEIIKLAKKYPIEDFFNTDEMISNENFINNYTRTFSFKRESKENTLNLDLAIENMKNLTAFGIMEKYNESVDLIFRSLELSPPKIITKLNCLDDRIQAGDFKNIKKYHMTDKLIELLQNFVNLDIIFYKRAVDIFEERYI